MNTVYEAPRADSKVGEKIVTRLRSQLRRPVRGQRARVRGADRSHQHRHAALEPRHPPLPACARGVGQIERTYHPDRLRYPMRRIGPRGSGEFERITGTRRWTRWRRDAAGAGDLWQRGDSGWLAVRFRNRCCTAGWRRNDSSTCSAVAPNCGRTCRPRRRYSPFGPGTERNTSPPGASRRITSIRN